MKFPVYRKINGLERWYKIVSNIEFFECYNVGSKRIIHHVIAIQYPEKLKIMDMLACNEPYVEALDLDALFEN